MKIILFLVGFNFGFISGCAWRRYIRGYVFGAAIMIWHLPSLFRHAIDLDAPMHRKDKKPQKMG